MDFNTVSCNLTLVLEKFARVNDILPQPFWLSTDQLQRLVSNSNQNTELKLKILFKEHLKAV